MGYPERVRASLGALFGVGVTALISTASAGSLGGEPLLIAPIGASAVLLFALPASPLAQPWAVIVGNLLAAVVGVTASHLISDRLVAAPVAVAVALGLTTIFRCVHPPAGAIALVAVLGGPKILAMGYSFVFVPVLLNSVVLTLSALLFHLATGHAYPHIPHGPPRPDMSVIGITPEDIDGVLAEYGDALDISREDVDTLVQRLIARAQTRGSRR